MDILQRLDQLMLRLKQGLNGEIVSHQQKVQGQIHRLEQLSPIFKLSALPGPYSTITKINA